MPCKCRTKNQGPGRCVTGQCGCIKRGESCTKKCHREKYCANHPLEEKDFHLTGTWQKFQILLSRLDEDELEEVKECLEKMRL